MNEIANYVSLGLLALVGGSYLIEPARKLLGKLRSTVAPATVAANASGREAAIDGLLVALDYAKANGMETCAASLAAALPELANPKAPKS